MLNSLRSRLKIKNSANPSNFRYWHALIAMALLSALPACSEQSDETAGQDQATSTAEQATSADSPQASKSVYWGDTHLHTANSVDAFGFGNRLDAEAALRFARGEEVTSTRGVKARLSRPLDFLVIADHSDALGATRELYEAPRILLREPLLRRWWDMMHESEEGGLAVTAELIDRAGSGDLPPALTDPKQQAKRIGRLWKAHGKIVDRYNEPGKFSAFIGFEYTPMPNGNNLHRVVMFRDGAAKTNTRLPFPAITNQNPENLWEWMASYEADTNGRVLAMPHNSNISNGLMFAMSRADGSPIDAAYAKTRAKFEPVIEVTQIKGDSETHPFLSPNDEFASFGVAGWELCNLSCAQKTKDEDLAGSYAREALKRGLQIERETGVNPYAFGMIGSTDSHTSLATADENNFYGKHTGNEVGVKTRATDAQNLGTREGRFGWHYLSSGYAAAWASENTREAIFDAFMRREVYATTGPRIIVKMLGTTQLTTDELRELDAEVTTEHSGDDSVLVPMGGELHNAAHAPSFYLTATMDPESATLDRIQIVKGWIDENGDTHEKVFNVAWSSPEQRLANAEGKIPAVGNSVNLLDGSWDNGIGAASLQAVWQDPEFNAAENAFYYARVLEIPTPTWAVYDALEYQIELGEEVQKTQQERAYTSPIWYRTKTN